MTARCPSDDDLEAELFEAQDCMTCCGDGFEECEDTDSAEGCWNADCDGVWHTCPNCRGSGRAKDQSWW
jgi:hypothetical protein